MTRRGDILTDAPKGRLLTVIVPVADLWIEPREKDPAGGQDSGRQTQVLMNEPLYCLGEHEDWYRVEAPEQQKLTAGNWGGYPGWIGKDRTAFVEGLPILNGIVSRGTLTVPEDPSPATGLFLSAGTRVTLTCEYRGNLTRIALPGDKTAWVCSADLVGAYVPEGPAGMRRRIVETAMSFVGTPYLWGGRSTYLPCVGDRDPAGATGVDCSGLVNLSHRTAGIDIPRDARDQRAAAYPVAAGELEAGDLIFLSSGDGPDTINHVMLFLGDERFIEAAQTGKLVEIGTYSTRFGQTPGDIASRPPRSGSRETEIYYGSFVDKG